MAFIHGKNASVTITDQSSSRDISGYLETAELDRVLDTADVSTFGVASHQYLPGLQDNSLPISGVYDTTGITYLQSMFNGGTASACTYGPAGTTSGYVKFTFSAFMDSLKIVSSVGDAVRVNASLKITGNVTSTTY